ncbi:hypothetical protein DASC09_009230 [Saccharomycopsis crataegensis]|uniref:Peptidyl-prolyl cis-trans isomerase n=1 Tax=Saccharomycopsis crataegensis TaxID=43959 RepID=A0AAV5QHG8_9ASCO|nr:hypothetical protein DASC09_009230 [Saccharomycopsis crataegensis]
MSVWVETTLGNLIIDLDVQDAPLECQNFLKLCQLKYYNYAPFLNLQKNFAVEIGDPMYPLSKTGCSIWGFINDQGQIEYDPNKKTPVNRAKQYFVPNKQNSHKVVDQVGTVALITNTDQSKASSKLLITLDENLHGLQDSGAVVFGKVIDGFSTLNAINESFIDDANNPLVDIRIKNTFIIADPYVTEFQPQFEGYKAPKTTAFPKKLIAHVRLPENLENNIGNDDEETNISRFKENEAKSQALTLEMIGDLPHADVKPLETILFVCKLNPITQEDDLQLIFSRFGKIKSCNIVKDGITGKSLQYAFIDFEDKKSCEAAYLKMDGIIIDDRRIHVDFSQSVWNYKNDNKKGGQRDGDNRNVRPTSSSQRHHHRRRQDHDDHRRGYYSRREDTGRESHRHHDRYYGNESKDRYYRNDSRDRHRQDRHRYDSDDKHYSRKRKYQDYDKEDSRDSHRRR